jgi:predicted TIM-barrel fold metal-dependent hydrolase
VDFTDSKEEIEKTALEIKEFLEKCGSDKLLFGTDYPVQSHRDSVYLVERAMQEFSSTDKEKVYYENARRLLGL